MATSIVFGKKVCKLPGSYARLVADISAEKPIASYSNILLIDTGLGKGYNSIKGIVNNGKECIYELTEETANYYIKGGALSPVINKLYNPSKDKPGIGKLFLIKASQSTPAASSKNSLFGGALTFSSLKTTEEGLACNSTFLGSDGKIYSSNQAADLADLSNYTIAPLKETVGANDTLISGFIFKAFYKKDLKKYYIEIHQGTYEGKNLGQYQINTTPENAGSTLVYRSKKANTLDDLVNFLSKDSTFKSLFVFAGLSVGSDLPQSDLEETLTFSGGTDAYITKSSDLIQILNNTINLDYSCMMIAEANDAQTFVPVAINHIMNDAKGIKFLAAHQAEKEEALSKAREYDSDQVIMISGKGKNTNSTSATGFIIHDSIATAAACIGRIFGLSPEIAGTLKSIDFDGMEIEPSDTDLEDFLDSGVVSPYYDSDLKGFVLSQVCTCLQKNTALINEDCTTFSVQVKRILAQVVKNLVLQSKEDFWGGEQGVNKSTLSDSYLKAWTQTLLNRLSTAPNKEENNYLLNYDVVKVETDQDTKKVSLSLTVNGEITKVFFLVTVLG